MGLINGNSNDENDEEIINYFIIQNYKTDNRDCNSSHHNILIVIRNVGRSGDYKNNKRDFLEPQYNNRRRVLKKKFRRKRICPETKRHAKVNIYNSQR